MGEPIAVLALRKKRDQTAATIAHYERLTREAEHDLAHVPSASTVGVSPWSSAVGGMFAF